MQYKIEIENKGGIFYARLLFKFSFDDSWEVKDSKEHAEISILQLETVKWYTKMRSTELKY